MTKIDIGWVDPGYVSGHFTHSIIRQAVDMQYFEALGGVHASVGSSLIAAARNSVVDEFLKGDSEWLWFVDSDMVFNIGHWLKLINMADDTGADMVTGLAFIFKQPGSKLLPSAFLEGPDGLYLPHDLPENGQELAACGLATVLINRRVFEKLEAPRQASYRWFDQIVFPNGQMSGEDTQFFVRAREAGFSLRISMEATTKHVKETGMGLEEYKLQQRLAHA
jgi:hypothetical protein